jgi:hypothetical protein
MNDHEILARQFVAYDALYAYCQTVMSDETARRNESGA